MFLARRKDSNPDPPPADAPVVKDPPPKKRFSWRRLKAAAITLTARPADPVKETPTSRVEAAALAEDDPRSPSLTTTETPVVLKTLRRTSLADSVAAPAAGSLTSLAGLAHGSDASLSVTSSGGNNARHGTTAEVEILAMIAAAKDRDATRADSPWRHVVAPRDVFLNDKNEHVVLFDALLELPLRDLPLRRGMELIHQLLMALEAIHALGIVHLDVNPANIMQDAQGNLVLIDFGLARVCDGTPHPPGRGTRGYIAPELFPPKICHSTTPDLYSAGLVLGHILEPYLAHCNLRILGGSASYPVHIEEVWTQVREFVELDALQHDDLFPPVLQLAGDLLLRLLTQSTPAQPDSRHRYVRLSAAQARRHPVMQVLHDDRLADKSFRYLTPSEWRMRRAGEQLKERQRRRGLEVFRLVG